jgi:hypothetical protein
MFLPSPGGSTSQSVHCIYLTQAQGLARTVLSEYNLLFARSCQGEK